MKQFVGKKLVITAMLLALAVVLSLPGATEFFHMPFGGGVTIASLVPIVIISLMYGSSYGVGIAMLFGAIQLYLGFNNASALTKNFQTYAIFILLDYIVAFGVIGLVELFRRSFRNYYVGVVVATVIVCILRLACHTASGILIWRSKSLYASLAYNATYMVPETLITCVVLALLLKPIRKISQGN